MERLEIVRGDITNQQVDAIVNAANSTLLGGGGVDGAIHRAAGPELLEECSKLRGCPTGQSKITKGYKLPAKHVIHTVGPVWHGGRNNEPQLLASCYRTALDVARQHNCNTVAFPAISCGAYAYPLDLAARVSIDVVRQYLSEHDHPRLVRWVLFDPAAYDAWQSALE
jgi:O-acetyl-ADP-ribose deacetylase (regulator of RNase III)